MKVRVCVYVCLYMCVGVCMCAVCVCENSRFCGYDPDQVCLSFIVLLFVYARSYSLLRGVGEIQARVVI